MLIAPAGARGHRSRDNIDMLKCPDLERNEHNPIGFGDVCIFPLWES